MASGFTENKQKTESMSIGGMNASHYMFFQISYQYNGCGLLSPTSCVRDITRSSFRLHDGWDGEDGNQIRSGEPEAKFIRMMSPTPMSESTTSEFFLEILNWL